MVCRRSAAETTAVSSRSRPGLRQGRGDHGRQLADLVLDLDRRSYHRRRLADVVLDLDRRGKRRRQLGAGSPTWCSTSTAAATTGANSPTWCSTTAAAASRLAGIANATYDGCDEVPEWSLSESARGDRSGSSTVAVDPPRG
jgi:hypothetical protein